MRWPPTFILRTIQKLLEIELIAYMLLTTLPLYNFLISIFSTFSNFNQTLILIIFKKQHTVQFNKTRCSYAIFRKHKTTVNTINQAGNSWMCQNVQNFTSYTFSKLAASFQYK